MLANAKGFEQEDQEFIVKESESVLKVVRQLTEDLSEQSAVLNVKYEVVSERLGMILKDLTYVRDRQKIEFQEQHELVVQVQRDLKDKWEERWKQSVESSVRRERVFKKWLMGLAVRQGVSVLLMVLYFIMK